MLQRYMSRGSASKNILRNDDFLDYPTEVCLAGILERKGKPRLDMAWKNPLEDADEEFVNFIKNYNRDIRPKVIELLKKHADKNIIVFNSREDAETYLS